MGKIRLALLSGGTSNEREISLSGGDQVYWALNKDKYAVTRYDPKTDIGRLAADADAIDFALIIMHGAYGEDGTIQGLLDLLDIPYQGSGVLGSAVSMDKIIAKQLYELADLPVPPHVVIRRDDPLDQTGVVRELGLPLVVKPVVGGSSVGVSIVRSEGELLAAVELALEHDDAALIEVCIEGLELTGGVIGNDDLRALPIVEIIPNKAYDFFDYEAKYTKGATREICPARIDDAIAERAQTYAKVAHEALFCRGYSRTDMILRDGEIFVIETNTIPGMTQTSLLPLAAQAEGTDFSQLLDELIQLGLEESRTHS